MNATAGPWHIQRYLNYHGFSIHADNRGCIAERWYDKAQDDPYGDEIGANAHLIAAAPDLLAACKTAMKVISEIADVDTQNRAGWALAQLDAAIAKAENVKWEQE